jgi:ClpA/ClpB-like protein
MAIEDKMTLHNRFTARARNVMQTAAHDARRLNHKQIDTEHILLGLVSEQGGLAATVLDTLRLHPVAIAMEIENRAPWRSGSAAEGDLPRSTAADSVIEFAKDEARELRDDYVGTEHLLLGLLREGAGLAARVLADLGLTTEAVRAEILRIRPAVKLPATATPRPNSDLDQWSEAERGFFVGLFRSAVDYYKPKIEKRTGVDLGNIAVWDYDRMHEHASEIYRRQISPWRVGIVRSIILRRRLRMQASEIAAKYAKKAHECTASYFRSAIYISFHGGARHEESVATTTVHELSHALWERISGHPLDAQWNGDKPLGPQDIDNYQLFVEGYATYAECVWFADLYPRGAEANWRRYQSMPGSVYLHGFRRIEKLVQQRGSQILLEIPKLWQTL